MHAFCFNVCTSCNTVIKQMSCPKPHNKSLSELWRDLPNSSQSLGSPVGQTRTIFFPPQQEIVTLMVPLSCMPVTYTWSMPDEAAKEVAAAILAEIPLQFRLAAVCPVSLFTCCSGHSSSSNMPHSSTVIPDSPGLPLQESVSVCC